MVDPETLLEKKAITKRKGVIPQVKILSGKAPFTVKIQLSKCLVSKTAKETIEKAGGIVVEWKPKIIK
jgi:ribosomal protein L15